MASAEYLLKNAQAKLIGAATEGFKIMTDMINLSRLYNSVSAIAGMRRAIIEAYQFLSFRNSFGKNVLEHTLVRTKLFELGSVYLGNFYMTWRVIEALDASECGDSEEAEFLRVVTPMTKKNDCRNICLCCAGSDGIDGRDGLYRGWYCSKNHARYDGTTNMGRCRKYYGSGYASRNF